MKSAPRKQIGFSLVEIIVVVTIISLLSAVGYSYLSDSRASARDNVRKTEVQQIALALRAYADTHGADVDCNGGIKIDGNTTPETIGGSSCPDGVQLLTFLETHFDSVPIDPLGPGNNDHYYYFDGAHNCMTSGAAPLVYAVNLEVNNSNAGQVCAIVSGNDGGYRNTTSYGGSINPSQPYVTSVGFLR